MKNFVIFLALVLSLSSQTALSAAVPAPVQASCTTTKEFVTTLEFLRSYKAFRLPEAEAQKLATQVSSGCTGAAGRFIKITALLIQAEMTSVDAIETATKFAKLTDAHADAFVTVFKTAFLAENLDLDFRTSGALALSLSVDYSGEIVSAKEDFIRIAKQCLDAKYLDLPRPECASFAARVARLGTAWEKGVSQAFFNIFEFLRSEKGPGLITGQALKLAEDIIQAGPGAPENFKQAYRYAISKNGLNLPAREALGFAQKMTSQIPDQKNPSQKNNDKKNVGEGTPVKGSGENPVAATGA